MKTLGIAVTVAGLAAALLPQVALAQGAPAKSEAAAIAECKAKNDPSILVNYWKSSGAPGSAAEQESRAKSICALQGGGASHCYENSGNAGPMKVSGTACDLAKPFTVSGGGGGMTVKFSYVPAGASGGKVSYTGGGPSAPMSGAGTYTVTLDASGGTIKQTHSGRVNIPMGGAATHTDILKLKPIPPC